MVRINSRFVWRGVVLLLAMVLAIGAILYGRLASGIQQANSAFLSGRLEEASDRYSRLLERFRTIPLSRYLARASYEQAVYNQAQILFQRGLYRETVELLEREAGEFPYLVGSARFHIWMGNALFRIAVLQEGEELAPESLQTIAEEYQEAIEKDWDNWDAKHNFEFITSLLAKSNSDSPADQDSLKLLLSDIRLTAEQTRGELPEKLH